MRGPNCGRHVWFGYEGGFAFGDRKLYQERTETASHWTKVGGGAETGATTLVTIETWTPGSSRTCMIAPGLKDGELTVEEGME